MNAQCPCRSRNLLPEPRENHDLRADWASGNPHTGSARCWALSVAMWTLPPVWHVIKLFRHRSTRVWPKCRLSWKGFEVTKYRPISPGEACHEELGAVSIRRQAVGQAVGRLQRLQWLQCGSERTIWSRNSQPGEAMRVADLIETVASRRFDGGTC